MEKSEYPQKLPDIINDIAQNIDMGLNCFYHPKTKEVITLFTEEALWEFGDDEEYRTAFKESLEKVEGHEDEFIIIEPLKGFESFKIMEQFIDEVPDLAFQNELILALERKNPFRNFKYLIDNSHFREKWFAFKQSELEKIVKVVLENNGVKE